MESARKTITFFVACYNEEGLIGRTLSKLEEAIQTCKLDAEIIIIDDCSTDKSLLEIKTFAKRSKVITRTIEKNKNVGLSHNFIEALQISNGEFFRLICGDDVEPLETFIKIFSQVGKADMIIPYHTECENKSASRKLISRIYTILINLITGNKIKYYNGLTIASTKDFKTFCRPKLGFSFQADFICQLLERGKTYLQIPVKTIERTKGRSSALSIQNISGACHLFRRLLKRKIIITNEKNKRASIQFPFKA